MTEWEEFRKEMGRWVQDIEMTISKHSIGLHQNLWERARLGFLRKVMFKTLESLKEKSERKSEESGTLESYTSGVSFVKESESHQIDVSDEYDPLPPAVIQPPNLKRISSQNVESMIETIQRNDVLMVRMPDRDDVMIKKYLLNTFDRREFTKNTPTAMCHVIQGSIGIQNVLSFNLRRIAKHLSMDQRSRLFVLSLSFGRGRTIPSVLGCQKRKQVRFRTLRFVTCF